jgi:hypothetical protein
MKPVAGKEDFEAHQTQRRQQLWDLLGDLPAPQAPQARLLKTEQHDGYTLEHLKLDLNGTELAPAYLVLPERRPQPAPALLYLHAHGSTYELGKEELIQGRKVLPPYAPVCAAKGIVALAIDSWCFSGRLRQGNGRLCEWDTFKLMLWKGQTLWGDVRRIPGGELFGQPAGGRSGADRGLWPVDGSHQGLVAGGAGSAHPRLH